jgi:hypothetical protein
MTEFFDRFFPDSRDLLMCILHFSHVRRIALALGLLGAFTLAGCDGGGGGASESVISTVKDGAHGKAQSEARRAAFGPTGNAEKAVPSKTPAPAPSKGPAEKTP